MLLLLPGNVRAHWMVTAFVFRILSFPDELFNQFDTKQVEKLLHSWSLSHQRAFGYQHMVYNSHVFSHMMKVRKHGELTSTSAYRFESFYGPLVKGLCKGTCSTGLQAIRNTFARYLTSHSCHRQLRFNLKITKKRDDTLLYTRSGVLFRLKEIEGQVLRGLKIETRSLYLLPGIDFNQALSFRYGGITKELVTCTRKDILGKGVKVSDIVSIVTKNVLLE